MKGRVVNDYLFPIFYYLLADKRLSMTAPSATLRLTELLHSKTETHQLVRSLTSLLDELLQCRSFVFKVSHDKRSLVRHPDDTKVGFQIGDALITDLSHPIAFNYGMREDLLIANIAADKRFSHFASKLEDPAITSAIVRRIRPVNHHAWGSLAVFFRLPNATDEQRKRELLDADLWVQLATTILERRIAEETLQTVEIRLDLATKAGGIGIYDWDLQTDEVIWNPQMYAIFGLSEAQFSGKFGDLSRYIEPTTLEEIRHQLKEYAKKRERTFRSSHAFIHASGERRHLESLGAILYNDRSEPIRLIGTAYDDTDALKNKEQLFQDRRRLELALEGGELGFWDWNVATGEVQFGGRWQSMLGYAPEEIEPSVRSWEKLVHPDDMPQVMLALKSHLRGETPIYENEHRLLHKNGTWIWVLDRGRVVERTPDGAPLRAIGIHADITQQQLLRERLSEADRRKDEFLATLAHELRNPLAPVRTGLAIIKKDPTSPAAAASRDMMERQLSHMVRLIDDLLDVSRITTGRLRLKKEDTSLRSILEIAVEASKPMIEAAHHSFSWTCPTPDPHLFCDGTRVAQSVSNLLTNAAKYTPDGGTIALSARQSDNSLEIEVTDNGLGIPADMQERIFDLFGQVNKTLDRAQGGLGIGLALVRNLIGLHGGEVSVYSGGPGLGSTFTIRIPKVATSRPIEPPPAPENRHPQMKHRVLIVDDNQDAARSLAMYTDMLGHAAEVAFTGEDALKQFETFQPDVVFLDLGLPSIDGLEVARRMRTIEAGRDVYLVAITGWGTDAARRKTRLAGFNDHLTKPVDLSRIDAILATPATTP